MLGAHGCKKWTRLLPDRMGPGSCVRRSIGLAIFGKNKDGDDSSSGDESRGFEVNPPKAKAWFTQAKTVQETGNYDYAMSCWLSGLAFDPTSMDALEGFMTAAIALANQPKSKGPSKETQKAVTGKGEVYKYTAALLAWGTKPNSAGHAVKAAIAAGDLELSEPAYYIGEQALRLTR